MFALSLVSQNWPGHKGCEIIIAETDGGMVSIMQASATGADKRRGQKLFWKEHKLCLAHAQGSVTPMFAGTLQGDARDAGKQLFACASLAGFGISSHVHVVGDGTPWIATQAQETFGANGSYLVDFYQAFEYLRAEDVKLVVAQE